MKHKVNYLLIVALNVALTSTLFILLAPVGYGANDHDHDHSAESEHAHETSAEVAHEHGETSDLDRSVADLISDTCEHKMPTYTCDECRYEVGVVKITQNLIDGGLIATGRVTKKHLHDMLSLTGQITFDERKMAWVSTLVSGIVTAISVDVGQEVKAGQPLITLRSIELAQAESDYLDAVEKHKFAQTVYDRHKSLRDAGVNSKKELQDAESELAAALIRVNATRQVLIRLGLPESDIKALIAQGMLSATGEMILRAPIAGTVTELKTVLGQLASPGEKAAMVVDPTQMWIWADLYERDLSKVLTLQKNGSITCTASVEAFPETEFTGTLDFIGSVLDEICRTVKVRVSVANPDSLLRPGMFTSVALPLTDAEELLVVPSHSVFSDEGRDFVFIHYEGPYYIRRPIVTGGEQNGFTIIKLGLEPEQVVVTNGAFILKSDVLRSKMGAGCAD